MNNKRSTSERPKEHQRETKENQRNAKGNTHSKTTGKPEDGKGRAVKNQRKTKEDQESSKRPKKKQSYSKHVFQSILEPGAPNCSK